MLHALGDNNEIANKHLKKVTFNQDQWKAMDFIRMNTGRIEINVNGELQRVYFPVKPVCRFISKGERSKLMETVERDS